MDLRKITSFGLSGDILDNINEEIEKSGQENQDPANSLNLPEEGINILPLRNIVVFPGLIVPLSVGRKKSIAAVEDTLLKSKVIGVITQKSKDVEDPTPKDLYTVGVEAVISKVFRLPDNTLNIVVRGNRRFRVLEFIQEEPFLKARVEYLNLENENDPEIPIFVKTLKDMAFSIISMIPDAPPDIQYIIESIDQPEFLSYFIASGLNIKTEEKQKILEINSLKEKMNKVVEYLGKELELMKLSKKIQDKVKDDVEKTQREYFLRQQLKAIQNELGELSDQEKEIEEFKKKLESKKMPEEAKKVAMEQIDRLSRIPMMSPEYTVTRNYVDLIISLPWNEYTEDNLDIDYAKRVLDEDHYDLEKVKKRILEYLAVLKLKKGDLRGSILCFYGPPGVGKTSLGMSIAKALGRKFVRISLGGVRDEAEIRGHRRTYVGALPGRIIQGIKKAGSSNPVFMLDEIDKLASDFRGDPASALLEVLDPSQNNAFSDHYLEIPYDLSRVFFITTANSLNTIPWPLLDRMEIISIPGYTEFEKKYIALNYLIPRQKRENGVDNYKINISDGALRKIITDYTREAGVRELERMIGALMRSIATKIVESKETEETFEIDVDEAKVREILGPEKYIPEINEMIEKPGIAIGLAWTPVGGDILFIESIAMPGKGTLILTGSLGNVMKESASISYSYVRANAEKLGIPDYIFKEYDIHIHLPSGATPKEGPSAGITLLTSMISLLTQRRVKKDVAMTGELSLRGLVLPVGGIREKILAAKRYGIKTVLIPEKNLKDLEEIPEEHKRDIEIVPVKTVDQVIDLALEEKPIQNIEKVFEKKRTTEPQTKRKSKRIKVIK